MDHPSTAHKLRAMKNSNKRNNNNFPSIYNLILQLLTAFVCTLLFSYSSFLKQFLFISIPSVISSCILSPKCLFVVANIIVFALIGESKLGGLTKPSPSHQIYEEYVKNRSCSVGKEAGVGKRVRDEKKFAGVEEEGIRREVVRVESQGMEEEMPNDEVNRRAEEFIARVNRQRWLEARSLMNLPVQDYGRKIAFYG